MQTGATHEPFWQTCGATHGGLQVGVTHEPFWQTAGATHGGVQVAETQAPFEHVPPSQAEPSGRVPLHFPFFRFLQGGHAYFFFFFLAVASSMARALKKAAERGASEQSDEGAPVRGVTEHTGQ